MMVKLHMLLTMILQSYEVFGCKGSGQETVSIVSYLNDSLKKVYQSNSEGFDFISYA